MFNNKKIITSKFGKTWLFDLDGTIVEHNAYLHGGDKLNKNVKDFFKQVGKKDKVIILTARDGRYKKETEKFLLDNGIKYDYIIFDLPKGERVIINDTKPEGLKTAMVININRNKFPKFQIKESKRL